MFVGLIIGMNPLETLDSLLLTVLLFIQRERATDTLYEDALPKKSILNAQNVQSEE